MRTIVDLSEAQLKELATNCKKEHISRSEAIRQAVDLYLKKKKLSIDNDVFGIWAERQIGGISYEDKIRDEWRR